jgi:hypothetical protein
LQKESGKDRENSSLKEEKSSGEKEIPLCYDPI